jgi:hypothetical protein
VRKFDDGYKYLVMDMSMRTDDKRYKEMSSYAILMIVIYPVGIIIINTGVLWTNKCYMWNTRDVLCRIAPSLCTRYHKHNEDPDNHKPIPDDEGVVDSLDFLVGAYSPKFWWFEVYELMRKLVLTGVFSLILPNTDTQITLGCLVCVGSFYFYTDVKPYINRSDNHLAIFAQFGSFMVLYSGLVMKMQMLYKPDSGGGIGGSGWLGWVLVGITATFPLAGVFFIVRDVLFPEHLLTKEQKRRKMLMEMTDEQKIMEFRTLFDHYDKSDTGWLSVKLVKGMLLGSSVGWEEDTLEEKFKELGIEVLKGTKTATVMLGDKGGTAGAGKGMGMGMGMGTKRVKFPVFYELMAGEKLNMEIYTTINKHLMRSKALAAEEKKLKKKPPAVLDFSLFVVHDDSKELPEQVKMLIDDKGMDLFPNPEGHGGGGFDDEEEDDFMDMENADGAFTTMHWDYKDMKKCKASKQSKVSSILAHKLIQIYTITYCCLPLSAHGPNHKDNRDCELFNIQVADKVFIFEVDSGSEVCQILRSACASSQRFLV